MAGKRASHADRMAQRFQDSLEKGGPIPAGSRVLLGYSGGADSTCLLHLLLGAGIETVAAHLHHSQRPEADDELLNCEKLCKELGVSFVSGKADVPGIAKNRRIGIEEAGREARYEFFRMAAQQMDCNLIVTAHTKTDLVETVLLNLARGAGLSGLAGIPARRGNIVRPLLGFTREETRAYCKEVGAWTHDDPANDDVSFARARVRRRVLPELRSINASVEDAVFRLAEIAGEEDRFLDAAAAAALERCEVLLNGQLRFLTIQCEAAFDRSKLLHLPEVLLRRAVRLVVESLGGGWDHAQTHALAQSIRTEQKGSFTAEGGSVVLEWDAQSAHVRHLEDIEAFRFPLTVPGVTDSELFGWRFMASYMEGTPPASSRESLRIGLDVAALNPPLMFRSALTGDRMQPLGFGSERKLSDLLGEAKLTRAARKRLPIVCDMAGPVWVPGVCLVDRCGRLKDSGTAKKAGERTLLLEFGPLESQQ